MPVEADDEKLLLRRMLVIFSVGTVKWGIPVQYSYANLATAPLKWMYWVPGLDKKLV